MTHASQSFGGASTDQDQRFSCGNDAFGWAKTPGVTPAKALAVVAGFAIFPPLGLGVLGWLVWQNRRAQGAGGGWGQSCGRHRRHGSSGNSTLDARQTQLMAELEEERRAFVEWREEQRRQRDAEAFEAFQSARAPKEAPGAATTDKNA